jgi:hypothetical protein
MKIAMFLILSTGLVLLSGCARSYVMKMSDGRQIHTASKPKLQHGYYVFKDSKGQPVYIPQSRVREIAPASRSTKVHEPFMPSTSQ